jgi:N utilization substance protein B
MMREAELKLAKEQAAASAQAQQAAANAQAQRTGARDTAGNAPRRVKKVSRSQARRHARERALQALYQWDVSDGQSSDIREQFLTDQDMSRVDVAYFITLFNGVSHHPQATDDALADALDRPIADLDPIERSVLRIAAYELTQCPDIPARVVINEGIEITKRFGADKGHRYVNGVLDKLATAVRPFEMKRR